MALVRSGIVSAVVLLLPMIARGQAPELPSPELKKDLAIEDLDQPVALAMFASDALPGDHLLVLEAGGRLLIADVTKPMPPPRELATLTPQGEAGSGQATCLLQLDDKTVLAGFGVGGRSLRGVAVFRIEPTADGPTAKLRQRVKELMPETIADLPGRYAAVAANNRHVYFALTNLAEGGLLARARHTAGMLSALRPLATARDLPDDLSPRAVAVGPDGYVVAAFASSADSGPAARLIFADPEPSDGSGAPVVMEFDLPGVCALAYGPAPRPQRHRLYALAASDGEGGESGLYRVDAAVDAAGKMTGSATLLAPFPRPVAMAFSPDGVMYVLTLGETSTTGA
ncbi:MAG: hypothetical protein AAF589_05970, partial [Planctomycetota bacterium]